MKYKISETEAIKEYQKRDMDLRWEITNLKEEIHRLKHMMRVRFNKLKKDNVSNFILEAIENNRLPAKYAYSGGLGSTETDEFISKKDLLNLFRGNIE